MSPGVPDTQWDTGLMTSARDCPGATGDPSRKATSSRSTASSRGTGRWGEGSKSISVEEMAVITATGAEYLVPPQQELVLIRSR
jgi:hypothetical protein